MPASMDSHDDNREQARRSRLEDEVLEILTRADRPPTFGERVRERIWRARRSMRARQGLSPPRLSGRVGPGAWLLASAITAIVALTIDDASPFLARVLAILCIVFFSIPIVMRWRRSDEPDVKRWRGRDIDLRDRPPDLLDDFRRRFRRPPKR